MQKELFVELYKKRNLNDEVINKAILDVESLEKELKKFNRNIDECSLEELKNHIKELIRNEENTFERLVNLARYFYIAKRQDLYIYFLAILGGSGVIESIAHRALEIAGEEIKQKIFEDIKFPPLGSDTSEYPLATIKLVEKMKEILPEDTYKRILAGNHHQMPISLFEKEKEIFEKFDKNIDEYLKDYHRRQVEELEKHCNEGKIWYEQIITPEVVEYVRNNPEVQGGVREGNIIYVTKIPFEPSKYIIEKDEDLKKYYACHCPFVRTTLITSDENQKQNIPPQWCYCSAGYVKLMFDIIFERELKTEILETPFKGDNRCRFAIHI